MNTSTAADNNGKPQLGPGAKVAQAIIEDWRSNAPVDPHTSLQIWTRRAINLLEAVHEALLHVNPAYTRDDLVESLSVRWIEQVYTEAHGQFQSNGGTWPPHLSKLRAYVEHGIPGFRVDVLLKEGLHKQLASVYGHHYYLTSILGGKFNSRS